MSAGSFLAAGGLLLFTRVGLENQFWSTTLPAELVMGAGLGLIFVPLGNVALTGVSPHDAGAAGAVVSASQQVGGSLGMALLTSLSVSAATAYAHSHAPNPALPPSAAMQLLQAQAAVHSFRVGFAWGAVFLVIAGLAVLVFVRDHLESRAPSGAPVHVG